MNHTELKQLKMLAQAAHLVPQAFHSAANPDAVLDLIQQRDELLAALKGYVEAIAVGGGDDKRKIMQAIRDADNAARAAITRVEA